MTVFLNLFLQAFKTVTIAQALLERLVGSKALKDYKD